MVMVMVMVMEVKEKEVNMENWVSGLDSAIS